jgi:hypothetical protein
MARKLKLTAVGAVFGGAAFVAAGLFALPLLPTVGVLVPLSVAIAAWRQRR